MSELVRLGLAILACYRLARLFAIDDGPGDVFLKLREAAGGYNLGDNLEPLTSLGRGVVCPHCWGVWIALALAAAVFGWQPPLVLLYWLAIAGGQSFLQAVSE